MSSNRSSLELLSTCPFLSLTDLTHLQTFYLALVGSSLWKFGSWKMFNMEKMRVAESKQMCIILTFEKQSLAATCSSSHLQPLAAVVAATCSHWLKLPVCKAAQVAASGCTWLQVAAGRVSASGCKRLQVAASDCKWLQVIAAVCSKS